MIKQIILCGSRPGHLQPFGDKNMHEQLVSCLNRGAMTIFIFNDERAFFRPKRKFGRFWMGLFACAFTCATLTSAQAVRFPSAKDLAQGDSLYQEAFSAYQAGEYSQAQALIEKADRFKPDQPDGWNLRGMVYLKQNAFDKAEAAFARAVALDPKLWAAQFNLAEAPFQGKDYARARGRFEKLLEQTDRYKDAKKWELVQYKAFLSSLLMGDLGDANRKLTRLPASGGVTPAYLYAQAALAYSRKDPANARKTLAGAQITFSPVLNELFSNSLVEAGWEAPTPPPVVMTANASLPASPSSGRESSGRESSGREFSESHAAITIDPQLEAAAAEPLPSPDSAARPVLSKLDPAPLRPALRTGAAPQLDPAPAPPRPARRTVATSPTPPAATPQPDEASDHRGLLLE